MGEKKQGVDYTEKRNIWDTLSKYSMGLIYGVLASLSCVLTVVIIIISSNFVSVEIGSVVIPFIFIVLLFGSCGLGYYIEKKIKEQQKINDENRKNKAQKAKEDREKFINKVNSSGKCNIYSANTQFEKFVKFIGMNGIARMTYNDTAKMGSAAIRGGIVDGLAGPAAGLYTAIKTEQDNIKKREYNQRNYEEKQKNIKETRGYYNELEKQFKIIVDATKENMSNKVSFLNQLPSDYDEMYNLCIQYIDSSDDNIKICARGLIGYIDNIKVCRRFI